MSSREVIENVQADLFAIQDLAYRDFQAKLMPTVNKETVIGVRLLLCAHTQKNSVKQTMFLHFLKCFHINIMKKTTFMDY